MLRLFQGYNPFTVLMLLIAFIIMKLQVLSHPFVEINSENAFLFQLMQNGAKWLFGNGATAMTILSMLLVFVQALYLNHIAVKHKLFVRNTYLPAFTYLLLTSLHPSFSSFSAPLVNNFGLLVAFDLMLSFSNTTQPRTKIFNAGFVLCIPILIQFSAVGYVLLFLMALVFLRSFHLGEWVVGTIGFFTPIYFYMAILFLIDQLALNNSFWQLGFIFPKKMSTPVYQVGVVSGLIILLFSGLFVLQQLMPKVTIYVRRGWLLILCYLIVSLLVRSFSFKTPETAWLYLMPPLSLVVAQSLCLEKSKRFSSFTFYFSLCLLVFSQLALNK